MKKLRISDEASAYLRAERAYIARFDKRAASAMILQLRQVMEMPRRFPQAGKALDVPQGVRRFSAPPYVIDYEVADEFWASSLSAMRVRTTRISPPTRVTISKISDCYQMFKMAAGFCLPVGCTDARGRGFNF